MILINNNYINIQILIILRTRRITPRKSKVYLLTLLYLIIIIVPLGVAIGSLLTLVTVESLCLYGGCTARTYPTLFTIHHGLFIYLFIYWSTTFKFLFVKVRFNYYLIILMYIEYIVYYIKYSNVPRCIIQSIPDT